MFFDKAKEDIYEQTLLQNVDILSGSILHGKQIKM